MAKDPLEKEDLPFEIPPFDEDEFVRKELISFRTTIIIFAFSLLVALTTFFIWQATGVPFVVIFLLAVATGAALPFIYRLFRIDIAHFKRKEWIGTMSLHFFFWLGFTLLLANPPFTDNASPFIDARATPSVQAVGQAVEFAAYLGDNKGLDESQIQFCLLPASGADGCIPLNWTRASDKPVWSAQWTPTKAGNYTLFVNATDRGGRTSNGTAAVRVGAPFPVVDPANGGTFNSLSQSLVVRADPAFNSLRAVQYVIDGQAYNMVPPTKERPNYWTTNPTYPGWKAGVNNVTIQAVEQPIYLHTHKVEGGIAVGQSRTYTVDPNYPDRATAKSPELPEKGAPAARNTPGVEAVPLLGILVVAAIVARKRLHARP